MNRRFLALLLMVPAGCATVSPSATPEAFSGSRPHVYLFRGFLGIWSNGMDQLADSLRQRGIAASVHANDDWHIVGREIVASSRGSAERSQIILVGHSFGADDAIRLSRELSERQIKVTLLVTVECCTPPPVPRNVERALNVYKARALDVLPWWRGVPVRLESKGTALEQIEIHRDRPDLDRGDMGHSAVDKAPGVQRLMLDRILLALEK